MENMTIVEELLKDIDLDKLYDIPNYSRYAADLKNGRIYNKDKKNWCTGNSNFNGYSYVRVTSDEGNTKSIGVHVLILKAALEGFDWSILGLEVDHRDFSRSNNSIYNLTLLPVAANRARRYMPKNTKRLDKGVIALLREEYKTLKHGEKMEWFRVKGLEYGVSHRCIQDNCLGYCNKGI